MPEPWRHHQNLQVLFSLSGASPHSAQGPGPHFNPPGLRVLAPAMLQQERGPAPHSLPCPRALPNRAYLQAHNPARSRPTCGPTSPPGLGQSSAPGRCPILGLGLPWLLRAGAAGQAWLRGPALLPLEGPFWCRFLDPQGAASRHCCDSSSVRLQCAAISPYVSPC